MKKVTPDMQTHKNPNLRTGPAPFKAPASTATNYSGKPAVEKSQVFKRDGKKWIIVSSGNVFFMEKCVDWMKIIKFVIRVIL